MLQMRVDFLFTDLVFQRTVNLPGSISHKYVGTVVLHRTVRHSPVPVITTHLASYAVFPETGCPPSQFVHITGSPSDHSNRDPCWS